jgi:ATP-dependent DNA ligase
MPTSHKTPAQAAPKASATAASAGAQSIASPISPMLAKAAAALPTEGGFLFEPKWDGMHVIVFRQGGQTLVQGRDFKSLNRYFPELVKSLDESLPKGCVIDGELVVGVPGGLDFGLLQSRIHPAETRIAWMARKHAASFIAFDLLAAGGKSVMHLGQAERRARLEQLIGSIKPPVYLTPMTRDPAVAAGWLERFVGAGLDGVMAKPEGGAYLPGKRMLLKIKHDHTADCVVTGFRWHKDTQDQIGSLLLGLYDEAGVLKEVGMASSFTEALRRQLVQDLAPVRLPAPAAQAQGTTDDERGQAPAWEPLQPLRACEVTYDHLTGRSLRGAAGFVRWRDDKPATDCRYDQLEITPAPELAGLFGRRLKK